MARQVFANLLLAMVLVLASSGFTVSHASIADNFTGADWAQWSVQRKLNYVYAFRSGENAGATTALQAAGIATGSKQWRLASARIGIAASALQIVKGVDHVYGNYRNTNLPIWEVIPYVVESIGGIATKSQLQSLRASYAHHPVSHQQ